MRTVFISIIIPAYKESERIGVTLLSLNKYFENKKYSYEIIVVNDGSPDDLAAVVEGYIPRVKNLRVINNVVNRGKGYAVKCGMAEARGKYRLFMDADNSVSIKNLDRFLIEIAKGSEVVIGSIEIGKNKKNEHNGLLRRLLSKLSKLPVRLLATPGIYDTQRGFKLFSMKAANIIFPKQTINRFAFDIELLVIAIVNKLAVKEVSVAFDNPVGSTVGLSAYILSLSDLLKITFKKMTGVYTTQSTGMVRATAGKALVSTLFGVFFVGTLLILVFLFKTGIGIQERSMVVVPLPVVVSNTSSQFHVNALPSASPSWLYSRQPMNKNDTGQLLIFSLLLMLLGADLIFGNFSPRLFRYLRKSLLAKRILLTQPPLYGQRGRGIMRKFVPQAIGLTDPRI